MGLQAFSENHMVHGLSPGQAELLFSAGTVTQIPTGEVVVTELENLHSVYVLLAGEVMVYLPESEIRPSQIDLTRKTRLDCFGEYSFVDHQPASASIKTLSDCTVYSISHDALQAFLDDNREAGSIIYRNLLAVLVKRLRDDNAELDLFNLV